ncbi:hypothetical protein F5883DRAFT_65530 [Diaporthe sp. PMI_573]|nr:hypothetical protein F5883DRAFT_65530 [Diaporthaceae sp. PMI_573]
MTILKQSKQHGFHIFPLPISGLALEDSLTMTDQEVAAGKSQRQDVLASLRYLKNLPLYQTTKPYVLKRRPPRGVPRSNVVQVDCGNVRIQDVRGEEDHYSLQDFGFSFHHWPLSHTIDNTDKINQYLKDVGNFVSSLFGSDDVRVFEYKFRAAGMESAPEDLDDKQFEFRKPSDVVHIDQTADSAAHRIRHHYPDEAEDLLKRRYQFVNVWRPLVDVVTDWPLAVCDSNTLADEDLEACDLVYDNYEGEHYRVKHSNKHMWYYWSQQTRDEVILIQNFDSANQIRCAHSAFRVDDDQAMRAVRKSIEVRIMVFYT